MNIIDSYLKKLDTLPELLDVQDLIQLGLFKHKNVAYRARAAGKSPSWIKMAGKILYPKEAVRVFIVERFHDGSTPKTTKSIGVIAE